MCLSVLDTDTSIHAPLPLPAAVVGPQVMCFDHNLVLLWEYDANQHFPHHARIKEVGVGLDRQGQGLQKCLRYTEAR